MRLQHLALTTAAAGLLGLSTRSVSADVFTHVAFDNSTIQAAGPRTGANNQKYFNMEGSSNNAFASFGVADFHASDFNFGGTVTGINSVQLQLTQSNASFTHAGALNFYLSQDTTTGIDSGTSPSYVASAAPDGIDTQLTPYDLVGTATFTPGTINTNGTGTVDTYTLTLSPADQSYLIQQLNGGGNVHLIVAPGDATVAATYAGFANTSTAPVTPGPTLVIDATATPEPMAAGLLGIGALALVRRRRA